MASEDSDEQRLERYAPLLATHVHRVGKANDARESFRRLVHVRLEHQHDRDEEPQVFTPRGELEHVLEERKDALDDVAARHDGVDEHVGIARLGPDPSATEVLLSHLQERASIAMLIDEELRLHVATSTSIRHPLEGDMNAALTFDHAG